VDNALLVGVIEGAGNGSQQARRVLPGDGTAGEMFFERAAGQVGHDEVGLAILLAVIGDRDDVRMVQFCQRPGLALEAFEGLVHRGWHEFLGADDLERHLAFEPRIQRLVDDGHPALAEAIEDVVVGDGLADQIRHTMLQSSASLRLALQKIRAVGALPPTPPASENQNSRIQHSLRSQNYGSERAQRKPMKS